MTATFHRWFHSSVQYFLIQTLYCSNSERSRSSLRFCLFLIDKLSWSKTKSKLSRCACLYWFRAHFTLIRIFQNKTFLSSLSSFLFSFLFSRMFFYVANSFLNLNLSLTLWMSSYFLWFLLRFRDVEHFRTIMREEFLLLCFRTDIFKTVFLLHFYAFWTEIALILRFPQLIFLLFNLN